MMKKIIVFGIAFAPFIVLAQLSNVSTADSLVTFLKNLLNTATGLILAAAVVFFMWGVFQFVRAAGDAEAQKVGRDHIIYGIIGIVVMVSLWGLVNFFTGSAGLTQTNQSAPVTGV